MKDMTNDHSVFLKGVAAYVSANPEMAGKVSDAVTSGLLDAMSKLQERAADMEVALAVALAPRFKKNNPIILSKLGKWDSKSSLDWSTTITELKESL